MDVLFTKIRTDEGLFVMRRVTLDDDGSVIILDQRFTNDAADGFELTQRIKLPSRIDFERDLRRADSAQFEENVRRNT